MCGRYTLFKPLQEINDFLNTVESGRFLSYGKQGGYEFVPKYNAYPTCVMPVAYENEDRDRVLEPMYWGFMKWKPKAGDAPFTASNTNDESILTKKMWKGVINRHRCIIPTNGFYEWHGPKTNRIPHFIFPTNDKFFGFAGFYSELSPDGEKAEKSYSIITTKPNTLMEKIHNRMPVILHPSEFDDWLNPEQSDTEYLMDFLQSYPNEEMGEHIVSKVVNSPSDGGNGQKSFIEKAELF